MRTLLFLLFLIPAIAIAQQSDPQLTAQMNGQMSKRNTAVFEENKGQMKDQHWQPRPDVLFNGSAQGMNYYIHDNGMSYQLSRVESWKEEEDDRFDMPGKEKRQVPDEMGTYRVDVEWTDFNADFTVEKGAVLEGYTNYYNVPEGVEPALFVKQYESVTLKGLWPGIDLRCYSTDGTLETDWLVAPGADYSQIRFEVKGAELSTDGEGHLIMSTPFGEIREGGLKVFQEGRQLEARWVITPTEGEVPGGVVSFEVVGHDPMLAMRIDPLVRVWGTYYGGDAPEGEYAYSCTTDYSGNVIVAGTIASTSGIASGGHQNTYGGGVYDAYLVKFDGNGERMWGTYYGGSEKDGGMGCYTKGNESIYLVGQTQSVSGIALGGHQNTYGGGAYDAFLGKFDGNGILQWATYYGGTGWDWGNSCAVDSGGYVYLAGHAASTANIASAGHQNTYGGGSEDAFLVKFDDSGALQWATYYGGNQSDKGHFCETDIDGNVYLSGESFSSSAIASGGHQNIHGGGRDAFLVKFNGSGIRQWATYYGGAGTDFDFSCAIDGNGFVYFSGSTGAVSGIAFDGHQNIYGGGINDVFLVKFDNAGVRQWATYYGGTNDDIGYSCVLDDLEDVYLAGRTKSNSNIASSGHQNVSGGGYDAFLAKFDRSGVRQWGTYFGGNEIEQGYSCVVDRFANVYLAGYSGSVTGIASGGHQNINGGSVDAFIVKFKQPKIFGSVWLDLDANCVRESTEMSPVSGIGLTVNPGGHIVQSDGGIWALDSLPVGNYTVTIDTTQPNWISTCPATQSFTVVHPDSLVTATSFGLVSTNPCPSPDVSIVMPQMRRGFDNQTIHVNACNGSLGTDILEDVFCIVGLDGNISVLSASLPYSELGDNQFQFNIGDLLPGQCVSFTLGATVELTAAMNQTLCISAELYPQPECVFDTIPFPFPPTVAPCDEVWDGSSLTVEAHCDGDTVYFAVTNTGEDMTCFAPVRVFVNGNVVILDSLMLSGSDFTVFSYLGNTQTWRLEADQHPQHPGNSNPSADIELCGSGTALPFVINQFPQDDADPIVDIFCGQVSAPFDPNDKSGFPLGLGETHAIQQNQQIEYLIRFQNVGTDTAVNVVALDTLSTDLNIFTVQERGEQPSVRVQDVWPKGLGMAFQQHFTSR